MQWDRFWTELIDSVKHHLRFSLLWVDWAKWQALPTRLELYGRIGILTYNIRYQASQSSSLSRCRDRAS